MSFVNENIQDPFTFETSRGIRYSDPLGRFGVASTVARSAEAPAASNKSRLEPNVAEWDATLSRRDSATVSRDLVQHALNAVGVTVYEG